MTRAWPLVGGDKVSIATSLPSRAQEQRRVARRRTRRAIGNEQRHEAGMNRHYTLAATLGFAHANQTPVKIHVLAVQAKQLRSAQTAIGKQRQQQTVTLALAGVHASPHPHFARHIQ
jgi:hypothetical protein